jgi:hypothetical protein
MSRGAAPLYAEHHSFGWRHDPPEARRVLGQIAASQPSPILLANTPLMARPKSADDDKPWFAWHAEQKVLGSVQPPWNQGSAGTCVSFGWGRGANDVLLVQTALGKSDWPGVPVATEPIYGLSRVEVGGGRISGDGSVGMWAARAVKDWGVLMRQKYLDGKYDLSQYSISVSRDWGRRGLPDELEPIAKKFPVKSVALCRTGDEAWAALGSGYPVPVCSGWGFDSPLVEGFCAPSGSWAHCMVARARLVAKYKGRNVKAFVICNSWGDYIRGEKKVMGEDGTVYDLPAGHFCIEISTFHKMLDDEDSCAISDLHGFPVREFDLDWYL